MAWSKEVEFFISMKLPESYISAEHTNKVYVHELKPVRFNPCYLTDYKAGNSVTRVVCSADSFTHAQDTHAQDTLA
jgi:hypothetical protein